MGIMHKLLKCRNTDHQNLIMDLTKTTNKSNIEMCSENETDIMNDISEQDLVPKLATDDNQFTAEHIVQLCKFLAEKSKRNKIHLKHLSHSQQKTKYQKQNQRESYLRQDVTVTSDQLQESRFNASTNKNEDIVTTNTTSVLTSKYLTDSNVCENVKKHQAAETARFYYSQDKREILLKIRNQIFERKRQQNLKHQLEQQMDVWRPW